MQRAQLALETSRAAWVDLPQITLDWLRVRQVLLNLLVNAARFTERGTITVEVAVGHSLRAARL